MYFIICMADQTLIFPLRTHSWRCGSNVFTVFKVAIIYKKLITLLLFILYYHYSYLDKNDAVTTNALKQCLRSSYTPAPKVVDLFEVWDAKQGLGEYIEDIRYHTQPHHFRFLLVGGRVQITYKYWSEDPEWQPEEDEDDDEDEEDKPLYILKDGYIPLCFSCCLTQSRLSLLRPSYGWFVQTSPGLPYRRKQERMGRICWETAFLWSD